MTIVAPVYGDIVDPAWASSVTTQLNGLTDGTGTITVASVSTPYVILPGRKYKTANETVNGSAVIQADDHLVVAVAASTTYLLRGFIMFTSGTTPDFKLDLSVPASTTYRMAATTWDRSAAGGAQGLRQDTTVEAETFALPGQGTTFATQSQWMECHGVLITSSTAGNVTVRWAQITSNASNTVVYAGSWIELVKA